MAFKLKKLQLMARQKSVINRAQLDRIESRTQLPSRHDRCIEDEKIKQGLRCPKRRVRASAENKKCLRTLSTSKPSRGTYKCTPNRRTIRPKQRRIANSCIDLNIANRP